MKRVGKALLIVLAITLTTACGRKSRPLGDEAREEKEPPRLVFFEQTDEHHLRLELNQAVDAATAGDEANYALEGPGEPRVLLARREPGAGTVLLLDVSGLEPGGEYVVYARNLRGENGARIETLRREFGATETADEQPPRVVARSPEGRCPDRPAITAVFNEAVRQGPEFTAQLAEVLETDEPVAGGDEAEAEAEDETMTDLEEEEGAESGNELELGPAVELEAEFNGDEVRLFPTGALEPGGRYQVSLSGVLDTAGNLAEEAAWSFTVREAAEGQTLSVSLRSADGTPLPPGLELTLSRERDDGAVVRLRPEDDSVTITGLEPLPARRSPYVSIEVEAGGYRYRGFYDEDGDGRPDRLGTTEAGGERAIELVLVREDVRGPELGLEAAPLQTANTLGLIATTLDENGVELVEAFLDVPGSDGTGLAFRTPPRGAGWGARRLEALLALPTADWEPGERRVLYYHTRDGRGNWSPLRRLEVQRPEEVPGFSGRLLLDGEPIAGGMIRLCDADGRLLALDASDEYGRFTLPRPESAEATLEAGLIHEGLLHLVRREDLTIAADDDGPLELELLPYPRVTGLTATLTRYQRDTGLSLPEDHVLIEARLTTPPGYRFKYELELDGERFPLSPSDGGRLSTFLRADELPLPATAPPRLIATPHHSSEEPVEAERAAPETATLPSHAPLIIEDPALTLTKLPFTEVDAADEGRAIRIGWTPLYGVTGYRLALIPVAEFGPESLPDGGAWNSGPEPLRSGELLLPEGEVTDYWGVPAGTRYVVALGVIGLDGDTAWSFGELIHP